MSHSNLIHVLTEKEEKALAEFRCFVADILTEEKASDDTFLLRWLIAREFNVEKASVMLKNWLTWRKENDIDNILVWTPPEDIVRACPYDIVGTDNEGRPVLCFPYGIWTPWEFVDKCWRDEYLKYMNQMLEKCIATIKPPATQFVIIADSSGFGFRHMTRLRAIEANLEALRGFEAHYPEFMRSAFVIKCPKIFSALYSLIRPLMSARTQSKLQICDSNESRWKNMLAANIPQHQLPESYRLPKEDDRSIQPTMVDLDFSQPQCVDVL